MLEYMVEWWNNKVDRWNMSLNIKNEETEKLARDLARKTGESLTLAVTNAIKFKLEALEKEQKSEDRLEWLRKLTERTAPLLKDLPPSHKIGDLLYDKETGLPL
jgi:antitoxin VapB